MQELKLQLKIRDVHGKKTKKIAQAGGVIGNVFGKGQPSQSVVGDYRQISQIIDQAGKTHPIQLEIEGGKSELALISEVERQPMTGRIHHVQFHVVHEGVKVNTEVPLKTVGDSQAEKTGKIIVNMLDNVEVEAMPTAIPEVLEVDISQLAEEGDSVTVADIKLPSGVIVLTDSDQMIARVEVPRSQIEAAAAEEEEASSEATDADKSDE